MSLRKRARVAKGLGRRDKVSPFGGALDDLDEVLGERGEVAEGLVGNGRSLAEGPSEQRGEGGPVFADPLGRSHRDGTASCCHAAIFSKG